MAVNPVCGPAARRRLRHDERARTAGRTRRRAVDPRGPAAGELYELHRGELAGQCPPVVRAVVTRRGEVDRKRSPDSARERLVALLVRPERRERLHRLPGSVAIGADGERVRPGGVPAPGGHGDGRQRGAVRVEGDDARVVQPSRTQDVADGPLEDDRLEALAPRRPLHRLAHQAAVAPGPCREVTAVVLLRRSAGGREERGGERGRQASIHEVLSSGCSRPSSLRVGHELRSAGLRPSP